MATEAVRARRSRVTSLVCVSVWLWVGACAGADPRAEPAQAPNPAARKCLEDGYELHAVRDAAGLPIDHDCVDKSSGRRCKAWDYFRGTCALRGAPVTATPK